MCACRYASFKALLLGFVVTFFPVFDVPVFWPILLMYWLVLFFVTMKRQIKHMIKYRYIPFSLGKKVRVSAPSKITQALPLWDVHHCRLRAGFLPVTCVSHLDVEQGRWLCCQPGDCASCLKRSVFAPSWYLRSLSLSRLLESALKFYVCPWSCRVIVKEVGRPGRAISEECMTLVHDTEHAAMSCGGRC